MSQHQASNPWTWSEERNDYYRVERRAGAVPASHNSNDILLFADITQDGTYHYIFASQSQGTSVSSSQSNVPRNIIPIGNSGTSTGYYGETSGFGTSQAGYTYSNRAGGGFDSLAQGFDRLTVGEQTSRRRESDVSRSNRDQRTQVQYSTGLATNSLSPGASYAPQVPVAPGAVSYGSVQYALAPASYGPSTSGARRLSNNGYANPRAYVAAQAQQVYAPVVAGPSTAEAQPLDEVGTQDDSLQGSLVQGGEGNGEMLLDPEYKVITEPWKFFKPGKVFATLWWESSGETSNKMSPSVVKYNGESAYVKIRRFIVVKPNMSEYYSKCLAISTYEGRATLKRGLNGKKHTIIYTGSRAPAKLSREKINKQPIQVTPLNPSRKLDERSRVNLAKTYPVEHNVKVMEIGEIRGQHLKTLVEYWKEMLED